MIMKDNFINFHCFQLMVMCLIINYLSNRLPFKTAPKIHD